MGPNHRFDGIYRHEYLLTVSPSLQSPFGGETPYGFEKRIHFVADEISQRAPRDVLDVGCGSGALLTALLAEAFPDISFLGIDPDDASIQIANGVKTSPNLDFQSTPLQEIERHFDLVIASEVIEHVEDPPAFLTDLKERLRPGGQLIITVPNGYGPMEFFSLLENLMRLSGVFPVFRALWRLFSGRRPLFSQEEDMGGGDTAANSPHLNFFMRRDLLRLFEAAGFHVSRFQARTVLCGFGIDMVVRALKLSKANASLADKLPPAVSSDWMFVLESASPTVRASIVYRRRLDAHFRRWLNEVRAGLEDPNSSPPKEIED